MKLVKTANDYDYYKVIEDTTIKLLVNPRPLKGVS